MVKMILGWMGVFFLGFVLQSAFLFHVAVFGVQPDLLFIALFVFAIQFGPLAATYIGFALGLSQDLFAPAILGQNALAQTISGFFMGLFNERVMRTDAMLKTIVVFVAFLLHDAIFLIVTIVKTDGTWGVLFMDLLCKTVPRAIYSMLFLSLVYIWEYFFKPHSAR